MLQDYSKKESAPGSVRERNIEERRRQILQAARVLLSRGGLKALSMRKLAEEASLSVNTLYNLWGTREEILRALTFDARDRMDAALPPPESMDDPIEYCHLLVGANVREMCREHDLFRPMILAWMEGEISGHASPIEPMARAIQRLSEIIRTAVERGYLNNALTPEQLAWQIHHGAQFASIQWALGRIDDAHFEARALYGLHLAFLGFARDDRRPQIEARLKTLESNLRLSPP